MKATVTIDLNNPMALPLLGYLESLPFATVEREKRTPPCQYTIEELHERIDFAMEDYRAGRTISSDELRSRMESW